MRQARLANTLGVSRATLQRAMKRLTDAREIKRTSNRRTGTWQVLGSVEDLDQDSGRHDVESMGGDDMEIERLIEPPFNRPTAARGAWKRRPGLCALESSFGQGFVQCPRRPVYKVRPSVPAAPSRVRKPSQVPLGRVRKPAKSAHDRGPVRPKSVHDLPATPIVRQDFEQTL